MTPQEALDYLDALEIPYQEFTHPPVFTCEESQLLPDMPGKKNKNLFLRDKKGQQYFLITLTQDKQLPLDTVAELLGESKISFASERRLMDVLGVEAGSVGLLALPFDKDIRTRVFIDEDLLDEDWVQSHPLVNTSTVSFEREALPRFFEKTGHQWQPIKLS